MTEQKHHSSLRKIAGKLSAAVRTDAQPAAVKPHGGSAGAGPSRQLDMLFVGLFLLCLSIPLMLFGRAPWNPLIERRAEASPPGTPHALSELPEWTARTEAWARDRFGLRGDLVTARAALQRALFGASISPGIMIGVDSWFFYLPSWMLDDFTGRRVIGKTYLDTWARSIAEKRQAARVGGAAYVFLFVPNKESIYPDMMPANVPRGRTRGLDRIMQGLAERLGDKSGPPDWIVDATPRLLSARQTKLVYPALDLHWNAAGAYVGYQALAEAIHREFPAFAPLNLAQADFKQTWMDIGDLAIIATHLAQFREKKPTLTYQGPALPCQEKHEPAPVEWAFYSLIPQTEWNCPGRPGRALVFGDSMMLAMMPYLAASFGHVRLMDQYVDAPMMKAFISVEHPDVIIDETVEREAIFPPPLPFELVMDGGVPPPAAQGGSLSAHRLPSGRVLLEGWAYLQNNVPGGRVHVRTERPDIKIEYGTAPRWDVMQATHDELLRFSGVVLRMSSDPGKVCVWSEDPRYGARRVPLSDPALSLCP